MCYFFSLRAQCSWCTGGDDGGSDIGYGNCGSFFRGVAVMVSLFRGVLVKVVTVLVVVKVNCLLQW